MIAFDGEAVLWGGAIGAGISALFFAGLGLGMRYALRASNPVPLLMLSAVLRMAALLGVGWFVVAQLGAWALAGYGTAFLAIRMIVTSIARSGIRSERAR